MRAPAAKGTTQVFAPALHRCVRKKIRQCLHRARHRRSSGLALRTDRSRRNIEGPEPSPLPSIPLGRKLEILRDPATVIGEAEGGWFWLPPLSVWERWAKESLESAAKGTPDVFAGNPQMTSRAVVN